MATFRNFWKLIYTWCFIYSDFNYVTYASTLTFSQTPTSPLALHTHSLTLHCGITTPVTSLMTSAQPVVTWTTTRPGLAWSQLTTGHGGLVGRSIKDINSTAHYVTNDVTYDVAKTDVDLLHVTSLVVTRGQDEHVASLTQFVPPRGFTDLDSLHVTGSLAGGGPEIGYIELEWTYPTQYQTSQYRCQAVAMDATGHSHVMTTTLEVIVRQPSSEELVNSVHLMQVEHQGIATDVSNMASTIRGMNLQPVTSTSGTNCRTNATTTPACLNNNNMSSGLQDLKDEIFNIVSIQNRWFKDQMDSLKTNVDQCSSVMKELKSNSSSALSVTEHHNIDPEFVAANCCRFCDNNHSSTTIGSIETDIKELVAIVHNITKDNSLLKLEVHATENTLGIHLSDIHKLQNRVEEIWKSVEKLQILLAALNETGRNESSTHFENYNNDLTTEIMPSLGHMVSHENDCFSSNISALKASINNLTDYYANLTHETIQKLTINNTVLTSQVDGIRNETENFSKLLGTIKVSINDTNRRLDLIADANVLFRQNMSHVQDDNVMIMSNLSSVQKEHEELKHAISQLTTHTQHVELQLLNLTSSPDPSLTSAVPDANTTTCPVLCSANITDLHTKYDALAFSNDFLKTDVNNLKYENHDIKTRLNSFKDQVANLTSENAALASELVGVKQENQNMAAEMSSMKSEMAQIRSLLQGERHTETGVVSCGGSSYWTVNGTTKYTIVIKQFKLRYLEAPTVHVGVVTHLQDTMASPYFSVTLLDTDVRGFRVKCSIPKDVRVWDLKAAWLSLPHSA